MAKSQTSGKKNLKSRWKKNCFSGSPKRRIRKVIEKSRVLKS